jgi:hypothetical protein
MKVVAVQQLRVARRSGEVFGFVFKVKGNGGRRRRRYGAKLQTSGKLPGRLN